MISLQNKPQPLTAWPAGWLTDRGYVDLWSRLSGAYGAERANAIANGTDEATNADLAGWDRVGGLR